MYLQPCWSKLIHVYNEEATDREETVFFFPKIIFRPLFPIVTAEESPVMAYKPGYRFLRAGSQWGSLKMEPVARNTYTRANELQRVKNSLDIGSSQRASLLMNVLELDQGLGYPLSARCPVFFQAG